MSHDIIVIGGSAGALEVLLGMAGAFPERMEASVFVVIHTSPTFPSRLAELLSRKSPLATKLGLHGDPIEKGHIYVAPPDAHLLVREGSIGVVRGPKENGQRPAVDALFRTASASYGSRVIGVVLSGYLDCGTAGMMSIKARGGLGVVQRPDTAAVPDMPRNVIDRVAVDHVAEPGELGELLVRLAAMPALPSAEPDESVAQLEGRVPSAPAEVVCPTCQGVMTVGQSGSVTQIRCHVGHTFSPEALAREQDESLERALWAAVRSLEESAALSRRLAGYERGDLRERFTQKAHDQAEQVELLRSALLYGSHVGLTDAPEH
jgi:two-component system chemotaxis response regulator CheB